MKITCEDCGSLFSSPNAAKRCKSCRPAHEKAYQHQLTLERTEHRKMFRNVDGHRQIAGITKKDGRIFGRNYDELARERYGAPKKKENWNF